jgi:Bacterial Ig domain
MPATISITSPTADSTVGTSFSVSGTCTLNHEVTVTIDKTDYTNTTTPTNGDWSTDFSDIPAGKYNITAKCGDPSKSTTVDNITVG